MIKKRHWSAFNTDEYCTLTFEWYRHDYEAILDCVQYGIITFEWYRHDYEAILDYAQYGRVLHHNF